MNLVGEEWIDVSLAMKSTNGFPVSPLFFFFLPNQEKQINNAGCWLFYFLFTPFLPLTFLLTCTSPVLPDTQNNLLNGMQNMTFAAFWSPDPLKSGTCHLLFHATSWAPKAPPLLRSTFCTSLWYQGRVSICFAIFPIPSRFRPEDLTFK